MKLTLQTYGGLTGTGQLPVSIDTDDLDAGAQAELRRLVSAASTPTGPEAAPPADPGLLRDAQTYQITIEEQGGPAVVLEAADGRVPSEFAQLRDWLRGRGN